MPLTRRQLIQISAAIEERRRALIDELGHEGAEQNDDVENADTNRDVAELRELDEAKRRIAAGNYGTCASCGGEIEPERLFARPGATRCIACQDRHERTHRSPAHPKL